MEEDSVLTLPLKNLPKSIASRLSKLSEEELALVLQLGLAVQDNICLQNSTIQTIVVSSSDASSNALPKTFDRMEKETDNPAKIGAIGEDYVFDILSKVYDVENVSRKAHSGDMFVSRKLESIPMSHFSRLRTGKLLVEVKNYSDVVPLSEVSKFRSDLERNQHINGGLFVSLGSRIHGVVKDFELKMEFLDRTIPTIYISSFKPEIILLGVEILWYYIDIQNLNLEENDRIKTSAEKIYRKVNNLADLLGGLSSVRASVDEIRNNMSKSLQRLYQQIFIVETKLVDNIHSIQNITGRITTLDMSDDESTSGTKRIEGAYEEAMPSAVKKIRNRISESQFNKKNQPRNAIMRILDKFFYPDEWVEIIVDKKTAIFRFDKYDKRKICVVTLELLKTKTNVRINIASYASEDGMIPILFNIEYDKGWLAFSIDESSIPNILSKIEHFIESLKSPLRNHAVVPRIVFQTHASRQSTDLYHTEEGTTALRKIIQEHDADQKVGEYLMSIRCDDKKESEKESEKKAEN